MVNYVCDGFSTYQYLLICPNSLAIPVAPCSTVDSMVVAGVTTGRGVLVMVGGAGLDMVADIA
jgi:hypothetical protein